MNQSAKFWDKIAKRYSKRPVADEASYQEKLRVTRTYFRPDAEVLEFGCGTGSTAINHSPYVRHIHAIDISSKMIEIAQEKADEGKVSNVKFEQSTIEGVSVPDQSLDAVLGLSILHLLENKEGAIAKVHRMLKPGGVFVTSTGREAVWLDAVAQGLHHRGAVGQSDRCRLRDRPPVATG